MYTHLERKLKKEIEKKGGLCLKFISPGMNGVPDRIVLVGTRVYFIELKTKTGVLSVRQKYIHKILNKQGHPVIIINDEKTLNDFINAI